MQGLTRRPSVPLQSGFMLCCLGHFTCLLSQALFAFDCFARKPLGG
jgi:hypothetical protein